MSALSSNLLQTVSSSLRLLLCGYSELWGPTTATPSADQAYRHLAIAPKTNKKNPNKTDCLEFQKLKRLPNTRNTLQAWQIIG